jgi:hypothetical protein
MRFILKVNVLVICLCLARLRNTKIYLKSQYLITILILV